ncbi:MAG: Mg2+ and Co2+ transporter, partial [Magnetospirillum sp.]|nr:Mg2+ and Co2+ transporter [Magnetospirillum sp.]
MITAYHSVDGRVITGGADGVDRNALWLDLFEPDSEEIALVEARTGLDLPSRHRMQEIEASSRLSRIGDAVMMTVPVLTGVTGFAPHNSAVTFILGHSLLVTLRHAAPRA